MADFKPPERKKTALDNSKLRLTTQWGDPSALRRGALAWSFDKNSPRITVFTNDPGEQNREKNFGKINANFDLVAFFTFLENFNQIIEGPKEQRFIVQNKNYIFPGGKRSEKPVVVSEVQVGKDAEGVIWIAVIANGRPKIKFPFSTNAMFHQFQHADGTPYTKAEESYVAARGYMRMLQLMLTNLAVSNYEDLDKPKEGGNGNKGGWKGNSGGGNNNGGWKKTYGEDSESNSGGNNRSSGGDFDDDIPY